MNWSTQDINDLLKRRPDIKIDESQIITKDSPILKRAIKEWAERNQPTLKEQGDDPEKLYREHFEYRELDLLESVVQTSLVNWYRPLRERFFPLNFLFAVPNGGKRHFTTAKKMKAEGLEKGVPDIMGPYPYGRYIGLAIEMKVKKNKPTKNQIKWLNWLASIGWYTCVCWSKLDAQLVIKEYFDLDIEEWEL